MKLYRVTSETDEKTKYIVKYFPQTDKFACECPSYIYGKVGYECKHIKKTKKYLEQKNEKKST